MSLILDERQVAPHLRWPELIAAMREAMVEFSTGRVAQPVRRFLRIDRHDAFFAAMPAAGEALGVKVVSLFPRNAARGIPTHNALILLFDPETGVPRAVMDGRLITEMRTAAVSALASDLLAPRDARTLAILGSGVQARAHVDALRQVRALEEVRIWSRTPEHAERLAAAVGGRSVAAEQAVRDADIVVTATAATQPVLHGAWLKPGCHVNAVGWAGVDSREVDDEAMDHVVIVDSREAALDQCGDVRGSGAPIHAEIGEILAGTRPTPAADATTVFCSVGIAIQDVAAAELVYRAACST